MCTVLESAGADAAPVAASRMGHLDWLEAESIHILPELVAERSKPALLFSGGKDSVVVLRRFGEGGARCPYLVAIELNAQYEYE